MRTHKREKTVQFFKLAKRLRGTEASPSKVQIEGQEAFGPADRSMTSRLKRACFATERAFKRAEGIYQKGGNLNEILAVLPPLTRSGAPSGNKNGRGKRVKPLAPKLQALWDVASKTERFPASKTTETAGKN